MADDVAESQPAPLVVVSWGSNVELHVPSQDGAEMRKLLDNAGVPYGPALAHSSGPVVDLLVAVAEEPAVWTSVAGVVVAYLGRNALRSVQVGDIVIKGESSKDAMRIIDVLQAQRDAQPTKDEEPPAAD